MGRLYPISLAELETWRVGQGVTTDEARKRFVQFIVLDSIANAPNLSTTLAFKGGNALRFIYGNKRSTLDLDFSAIASFPDDPFQIRALLDQALFLGGSRFGVKCRCQSVKRNPPGTGTTFPTYAIKIGYAFPNDRHFVDFESRPNGVSTVVDVEISLNDLVCESTLSPLNPLTGVNVRVCVLEDILAEKLRALLQQLTRNRHRKQDVFDIARMMRDAAGLMDRTKIAAYLIRKARSRNIDATRSAFNEQVREKAEFEYGTLFDMTGSDFIPFSEAWGEVMKLVSELDLPP